MNEWKKLEEAIPSIGDLVDITVLDLGRDFTQETDIVIPLQISSTIGRRISSNVWEVLISSTEGFMYFDLSKEDTWNIQIIAWKRRDDPFVAG